MNSKIMYALWDIDRYVQKHCPAGQEVTLFAEKVQEPFFWWVSTGRCDGTTAMKIANLSTQRKVALANLLVKLNPQGTAEYRPVIEGVKEYLNRI